MTQKVFVLLAGLGDIANPVRLSDTVVLQPLPEELTIFDLAAVGAKGFREWTVLEPLANACSCEFVIEGKGNSFLNDAWLASALLTLRGLSLHMPLASSEYSWGKVSGCNRRGDYSKLAHFSGYLLEYRLNLLTVDATRQENPKAEDIAWVKMHYESAREMIIGNPAAHIALMAATEWRYARDYRGAIAQIWGGIEAIIAINTELVFRLSLIASSLLYPPGEERRIKFNDYKKLYVLRSKVVHGVPLKRSELVACLNASVTLLLSLITRIIERGTWPSNDDLEAAIFS